MTADEREGTSAAAAVESLGDLFERAYAPMVRLAYLLTGSNEAAEDLVQDCFARLHDKWEKVEQPGAYLRASVANACRSWHRRRHREERRLQSVVERDEIALGVDELLDAVGKLPYAQRTALVLRYYEHCDEAEIAAALGCPRNTVKSHLHRGIAALRLVVEK